jgi:hypothetical protein
MATSSTAAVGYTYTLTPAAFAIPILHAARYSSSTVTGVLLGRTPATSSSDPSSSKTEIFVEDAVPLLHHYTSLSAMMEVALDLVQEYAGAKGWRVVGYYEAREDGEGMSRQGERVLRALRAEWDGVFGLVVSLIAVRQSSRRSDSSLTAAGRQRQSCFRLMAILGKSSSRQSVHGQAALTTPGLYPSEQPGSCTQTSDTIHRLAAGRFLDPPHLARAGARWGSDERTTQGFV